MQTFLHCHLLWRSPRIASYPQTHWSQVEHNEHIEIRIHKIQFCGIFYKTALLGPRETVFDWMQELKLSPESRCVHQIPAPRGLVSVCFLLAVFSFCRPDPPEQDRASCPMCSLYSAENKGLSSLSATWWKLPLTHSALDVVLQELALVFPAVWVCNLLHRTVKNPAVIITPGWNMLETVIEYYCLVETHLPLWALPSPIYPKSREDIPYMLQNCRAKVTTPSLIDTAPLSIQN